MNQFFKNIISVAVSATFIMCLAVLQSDLAEAQVTLKIGTRILKVTANTSPETARLAIVAIRDNKATLVLPPKKLRRRTKSFKIGKTTTQLKGLALNISSVRLNPESSNGEILKLSRLVMEELARALKSGQNQNQLTVEPPSLFMTVFKAYSTVQCQSDGLDVENLDQELTSRSVKIISSYCAAAQDNGLSPLVCGQPSVLYRMHVIDLADLSKAVAVGFSPMDWLTTPVVTTNCKASDSQPIEMVGKVSNVTCEPIENTVEDFDKWLLGNGLKVLEASCGYETFFRPPMCGLPDVVYRSVKISPAQRTLALNLGLKDKQSTLGLVAFGQACPTPKGTDSSADTVDLVGVISNVVCNPPQNTVAAFDKDLVDSGITIIRSSCGYLNTPTMQPCQDVFRAVTIPKSQEVLGLLKGLFSRSVMDSSATFGQSCPL